VFLGVKALGYALRALLDESQWCPKHGKAVCTLAVKLGCMTEGEWGDDICKDNEGNIFVYIDVYLYTYRFIDINVLDKELSHKKRAQKGCHLHSHTLPNIPALDIQKNYDLMTPCNEKGHISFGVLTRCSNTATR